jgi:hypothetical protein
VTSLLSDTVPVGLPIPTLRRKAVKSDQSDQHLSPFPVATKTAFSFSLFGLHVTRLFSHTRLFCLISSKPPTSAIKVH